MVAMSLWATDLRQITGAVGSQIRMEIYARTADKMVTYYYLQKLAGGVDGDIDLADLDYQQNADRGRQKAATHKVKMLGETEQYPRVTGHSDIDFFTHG